MHTSQTPLQMDPAACPPGDQPSWWGAAARGLDPKGFTSQSGSALRQSVSSLGVNSEDVEADEASGPGSYPSDASGSGSAPDDAGDRGGEALPACRALRPEGG